jgi:hypothetical protein
MPGRRQRDVGEAEENDTMTQRRVGFNVLAPLGAMLVLAGCGGSSHATTTKTTTAQSKAAYIAKADAICQQLRTSLGALAPQTKRFTALGTSAQAFAVAVPLFHAVQALEQTELNRLKALPLPAGDITQVTAYLQHGTAAVALTGTIANAFAHRDRTALAAAERQGVTMAAATRGLAQGYGFKICGNGSGNGLT